MKRPYGAEVAVWECGDSRRARGQEQPGTWAHGKRLSSFEAAE
jgi:hypothetical protein